MLHEMVRPEPDPVQALISAKDTSLFGQFKLFGRNSNAPAKSFGSLVSSGTSAKRLTNCVVFVGGKDELWLPYPAKYTCNRLLISSPPFLDDQEAALEAT